MSAATFGDPRLPERFWRKVTVTEGGCWQWTAALHRGYGIFGGSAHKTNRAHRYCYLTLAGGFPDALDLDHLCRNIGCVNPAHLEPVTHAENMRRGTIRVATKAKNAARTHCVHGHELIGENLILRRRVCGDRTYVCRVCRTCKLGLLRQRKARHRAAQGLAA